MTKTKRKTLIYLFLPLFIIFSIVGVCMLSNKPSKALASTNRNYDVYFTKTVSYFGSEANVNIADGEQLTMEFDVTYSDFFFANFDVGFIITQVQSFDYDWVETAGTSFVISGNAAYSQETYPNYCIGGNAGTITGTTMTGEFLPYKIFAADNSVKVVYQPYVSESVKGSLSIYTKDVTADVSEYSLAFSIVDIPEAYAPKNNVRILMRQSEPAFLQKDFEMSVANYRVYTQSDEDIPAIGTHKNCTITKAKKRPDPTVLQRATISTTGSGCFAAVGTFDIDSNSVLSMEFSVLESTSFTENCWLGFGYSVGLSAYSYTSGNLFYMRTDGAQESGYHNIIPTKNGNTDMLYVFAEGHRVKAEYDMANGTFSIYRKNIGDKSYGEALVSWAIDTSTIIEKLSEGGKTPSINFPMFWQNGVDLDLANVVYTLNGERQKCVYTAVNATLVTENNKVVDYAATISAVKKYNETAGTTLYSFDDALTSTKELTYSFIGGSEYSLKFYDNDVNSALTVNMPNDKQFIKVGYDGNKITIYGKNLGEEYTTIDSINYSAESYHLGFYLENTSDLTKSIMIDDFAITEDGDTTNYDFNCGLYENFTATVVGRGGAKIIYDYAEVTFYEPNGNVMATQFVGIGNTAKLPEGEFDNIDLIENQLKDIGKDTGIVLIAKGSPVIRLTNGTFADGTTAKTFSVGDTVNVIANADINGTFIGWYLNGELVHDQTTYEFIASGSLELVAVYKFNVSLVGGQFTSGENSKVFNSGDIVSIVAPNAQTGYVFDGWFNGANRLATSKEYQFVVFENCTLTAKYSPEVYTINIENGTSNGESVIYVEFGTQAQVVANSRTGYNFVGWFLGGTKVSDDVTYSFSPTTSCTLTATYEIISLTLTVENGRVNGDNTQITVDYGTNVIILATVPENKTFDGWYITDTQTLYSKEVRYEFKATENLVLTAKFKDFEYILTLDNANVSGQGKVSVVKGSTVQITANEPNTGYVFSHWLIDGVETQGEQTLNYTADKDTVIMAIYTKIPYTITVDGGTIEGSSIVYYGDIVTVLAEERKDDLKFDGWYVGEELVSKELNYSFEATGNTTIEARYVKPSSVGGGLDGLAIAGIVIGSVLGALILTFVTIKLIKAKKTRKGENK